MITEKFNYASLDRTTLEGKRHYCLPDGTKVPSVTTILDRTKPAEARQKLQEWKDRVGHEKAQQITTEAANRGTRMHAYLESYILSDENGVVNLPPEDILPLLPSMSEEAKEQVLKEVKKNG